MEEIIHKSKMIFLSTRMWHCTLRKIDPASDDSTESYDLWK